MYYIAHPTIDSGTAIQYYMLHIIEQNSRQVPLIKPLMSSLKTWSNSSFQTSVQDKCTSWYLPEHYLGHACGRYFGSLIISKTVKQIRPTTNPIFDDVIVLSA